MPPRRTSTAPTRQRTKPSPSMRAGALVIGSGPIRIGQGIEFDYCSVHAAWALQQPACRSIMVELEPGDRLHRLRHQRPAVLRAAGRGSRARHHRERTGRCRRAAGAASSSSAARPRSTWRSRCAAPSQPIIGSSAETIDMAEDRRLLRGFLQRAGHPAATRRRDPHHRRCDEDRPDASAIRCWCGRQLRARRPRHGDRPERRPSSRASSRRPPRWRRASRS